MSAHQLPLFEADGVTHTGDCPCPPCDEGRDVARPPQAPRGGRSKARGTSAGGPAAAGRARPPTAEETSKAEAALARRRARRRSKALALSLELEEEERRTRERIDALSAQAARVDADEQLEALLARRRAGAAPEDAIAEVEAAPQNRSGRAR